MLRRSTTLLGALLIVLFPVDVPGFGEAKLADVMAGIAYYNSFSRRK